MALLLSEVFCPHQFDELIPVGVVSRLFVVPFLLMARKIFPSVTPAAEVHRPGANRTGDKLLFIGGLARWVTFAKAAYVLMAVPRRFRTE